MEASSAKIYASLVILFLFAIDLAKNDVVHFVEPAAAASVRGRISGGRDEAAPQVDLAGPDKECSIAVNQTVWFPQTGQCELLLAKGPCETGHWLVMSADRKMPICKKAECRFPQVRFNGTCVQSKDQSRCNLGMHVTVTETGDGVCDCRPAHVYWKPDGNAQENCYPLFRQGPCAVNEYLVFSKRTQKVKCARNRCPDGEVKPKRSPECIPLDTPGGPCNDIQPHSVLTVNETTMELNCAQPLGVRQVIDAPLLNCSPGSRRDAAGKCRRSII